MSLVGLLTDGGQGLATGNNGNFVGFKTSSRFAYRCRETRIDKLWSVIESKPEVKKEFKLLGVCNGYDAVKDLLESLDEQEIWALFDDIKAKYGLRIFGKGYMYRIIPDELIFDVTKIADDQKTKGLKGKRYYVPYDKGDKEGNRWYLETPYLIDWSEEAVSILSTDERARWQGYQFFFRNGFCWSDVLNPNSQYIKCRLKGQSVNDVKSMSLYDETGIGDKYLVLLINSFLSFKTLREFINGTVAIQMNDIRKLPIKIPTESELKAFNTKFDECLVIKKQYFADVIDRKEMNQKLKPIEAEIDQMVNHLYGIEAKEEIVEDELDLELVNIEEIEEDDE
jgi:hypothetical protein